MMPVKINIVNLTGEKPAEEKKPAKKGGKK